MDEASPLTYDVVGYSEPAQEHWSAAPIGYRRFERSARLGEGDSCWSRSCDAVLAWAVKTRSGFVVEPAAGAALTATAGVDYTVTARIGPLDIVEPVRVVSVVSTEERCGFAYGTRPGHPVCGEEAFIVNRNRGGDVFLTIRSLTRAAPDQPWRALFPLLLAAQPWYRRRYLRSLASPGRGRRCCGLRSNLDPAGQSLLKQEPGADRCAGAPKPGTAGQLRLQDARQVLRHSRVTGCRAFALVVCAGPIRCACVASSLHERYR